MLLPKYTMYSYLQKHDSPKSFSEQGLENCNIYTHNRDALTSLKNKKRGILIAINNLKFFKILHSYIYV